MVEIRPARSDEWRAAFRVLVRRPGASLASADAQVDALLALPHLRSATLHPPMIAAQGTRLLAACACLELPGRTGIVLVPALCNDPGSADLVVELLRAQRDQAFQHGVRLLQVLLEPGGSVAEAALAQAGYELLAELLYMERDARLSDLPSEPTPALTWETYEPSSHSVFAETIAATYEGSLDCAKLNGLREIEDIIAGHKAAGEFDPQHWFVARLEGRPAGVLLLAGQPMTAAMEIVYMGVAPWARHRGTGSAIVRRALEVAHADGAAKLTLAVDDANEPARRLYERFGLRQTGRRRAWIQLVR